MLTFSSFEDRFRYLNLAARVGLETFGAERFLNQTFYRSDEWKKARRKAIIRDNGCEMGLDGFVIHGRLIVHHINPLTIEEIESHSPSLVDLENLVCVSFDLHNAIHYGDERFIDSALPAERFPGDTSPWLCREEV
jgi:hypothetical protein